MLHALIAHVYESVTSFIHLLKVVWLDKTPEIVEEEPIRSKDSKYLGLTIYIEQTAFSCYKMIVFHNSSKIS